MLWTFATVASDGFRFHREAVSPQTLAELPVRVRRPNRQYAAWLKRFLDPLDTSIVIERRVRRQAGCVGAVVSVQHNRLVTIPAVKS